MIRDIITAIKQQVLPKESTRYGVVIGIEQYRDPRLNLKCARADAQAVYGVMTDPECGMFMPDNVALLVDEDATKEAMWNALAQLRRKVGTNDTVWVYYAGHGASEGNEFYWVPYDGNVDDLYTTGLARHQISRVLNDIAAERVITFLDCCHAAATAVQKNPTRVALTAEEMLNAYKGKGRVIVSASEGREKSVELAEKGHGAFTYFMVQGLRGEADKDGTGIIHLDGLWGYLQDKVSDASRQVGNPQTPMLIGEHSHRLALTLNPMISEKKRQIADKIRQLVGLDDEDLTTEEARTCLRILRDGPSNPSERTVYDEFNALLEGQLRITVFKKLIQSIVPTVRKKSPIEAQSSSKVVSDAAGSQDSFKATSPDLAEIQKKYELTSEQAMSIIDAWSIQNPQYLNPLSKHTELIDCNNTSIYKVQITALTESREASLKYEPFDGSVENVAFAEPMKNKWDVNIIVPNDFNVSKESWQSPKPRRILTCDTCGGKGELTCSICTGTGLWVCDECRGNATVMCLECKGTGKDHRCCGDDDARYIYAGDGTFSENRKCKVCHGEKVLPCTSCKGVPKKTCSVCGGQKNERCKKCASSGKMAEYDSILTTFICHKSWKFIQESFSTTINMETQKNNNVHAFPLLTTTIENDLRLNIDWLKGFSDVVKHEIKQYWDATIADMSGKTLRIKLEISFIPCTICKLKHESRLFEISLFGPEHKVITSGDIPEDVEKKRMELVTEQITRCCDNLKKAKTGIIINLILALIFVSLAIGVSYYRKGVGIGEASKSSPDSTTYLLFGDFYDLIIILASILFLISALSFNYYFISYIKYVCLHIKNKRVMKYLKINK